MVEIHWGEHHRGYVESLNKQIENNDIFYGCTMEQLIKLTYNNGNPLPEFSDAAQVIFCVFKVQSFSISTKFNYIPSKWRGLITHRNNLYLLHV